ncbi:MAG TPA: cupin domain-containing protein [Anaerolineaceae bacterium]|nr:cupin domain-containing protein [Anaerolineaceae bacterium]
MGTETDELVQRLIVHFGLEPLAVEGGYYTRTYRSPETIPASGLPARYREPHPLGGAILYLLTADADSFSALHALPTDEIYHFYLGDPVEMLLLHPGGASQRVILGQEIFAGQQVQFRAPAGAWQGSRLKRGGWFALLGTTMAPGYIDSDYTPGVRDELIRQFPGEAELIRALTRG